MAKTKAETGAESAGIAEPESDARPAGSEEAPQEQETSPEASGESQSGQGEETSALAGFLEQLSPEEFDRILQVRPGLAESSAYLRERERRAEQRGLTRAQERLRRVQDHDQALSSLLQQAEQADAYLAEVAERIEGLRREARRSLGEGDTDEAAEKLAQIDEILRSQEYVAAAEFSRLGERLRGSTQAVADIAGVIGQHRELVGKLSPEEEQKVIELLDEDARRGTQKAYAYTVDLLIQRAKQAGIEEGKALGRKEAEADLKLLERAESLLQAREKGAPAVRGRDGRPVSERQRLVQEMTEIDVTTPEGLRLWREREAEFHRALQGG